MLTQFANPAFYTLDVSYLSEAEQLFLILSYIQSFGMFCACLLLPNLNCLLSEASVHRLLIIVSFLNVRFLYFVLLVLKVVLLYLILLINNWLYNGVGCILYLCLILPRRLPPLLCAHLDSYLGTFFLLISFLLITHVFFSQSPDNQGGLHISSPDIATS